MLEQELAIYHENKAKLLEVYPQGGYVVIKNDILLGVWNDREDALREGLKAFGDVSFLVKSLIESPLTTITFTRDIKFLPYAHS